MKISPVEAELFHAVGYYETNSRFSQFYQPALKIAQYKT